MCSSDLFFVLVFGYIGLASADIETNGIASTIDELEIGNSASHNTTIVGTLSIQEATADNHAVTKSYVDTQDSNFTSSINSNVTSISSNIANIGYLSTRSEERRVGKECRSRWSPYH